MAGARLFFGGERVIKIFFFCGLRLVFSGFRWLKKQEAKGAGRSIFEGSLSIPMFWVGGFWGGRQGPFFVRSEKKGGIWVGVVDGVMDCTS